MYCYLYKLIIIVTENKNVSRLPKSNNSAERGENFQKKIKIKK